MQPLGSGPFTALIATARRALWRPARLCDAARTAREAGDCEMAARYLDEARQSAPQWAEPVHEAALVAKARGERDEQERLEYEVLAREPDHRGASDELLALEAWRRKPVMDAWAHYHARRWSEARDAFFAALALVGARVPWICRAEIFAGLGWCHLELGAHAWAADAFWEALAVEPAHVGARKGLAIGWYRLGWFAKAEALLASLLDERPELGDAWAFYGWSAYGLERWSEALSRFERACDADPSLADAQWGRAWSLFRLRRAEDANAAFCAAFAQGALHPSRLDVFDVATTIAAYGELLEPLAVALVRAGATSEVEARLALLEPDATQVVHVARLRHVLVRTVSDPLLDALQAVIERRPAAVERSLEAATNLHGDERGKCEWLRARAYELLGNFSSVDHALKTVSARYSWRREWLELATRVRSVSAEHAGTDESPSNATHS